MILGGTQDKNPNPYNVFFTYINVEFILFQ